MLGKDIDATSPEAGIVAPIRAEIHFGSHLSILALDYL